MKAIRHPEATDKSGGDRQDGRSARGPESSSLLGRTLARFPGSGPLHNRGRGDFDGGDGGTDRQVSRAADEAAAIMRILMVVSRISALQPHETQQDDGDEHEPRN